jgi:hypothetical protein
MVVSLRFLAMLSIPLIIFVACDRPEVDLERYPAGYEHANETMRFLYALEACYVEAAKGSQDVSEAELLRLCAKNFPKIYKVVKGNGSISISMERKSIGKPYEIVVISFRTKGRDTELSGNTSVDADLIREKA